MTNYFIRVSLHRRPNKSSVLVIASHGTGGNLNICYHFGCAPFYTSFRMAIKHLPPGQFKVFHFCHFRQRDTPTYSSSVKKT